MFGIQENQKSESVQNASQLTGTGQKEKVCFKCGGTKELNEFYKHPRMADGHVNKCKECNKKDVSQNYQVNREYYAGYERERFRRPKRKAKAIEYQRNRRAANPEKYKANTKVGNAVRGKKIEPDSCLKCGKFPVEAHHPDYTKPLEIVWLCRACHLAEHGKKAYVF